jgi:hypothetical protein
VYSRTTTGPLWSCAAAANSLLTPLWRLQVEVLNTVTGMVTSFPYNRWIDVGAEEVLLNADTSTQVRSRARNRVALSSHRLPISAC